VVCDYGQLELRVLAHMTRCESMLHAFEAGGDFHSRTALGMYPHIQKAVKDGEVLLEWDGGATGEEPCPVPLIKDQYASERRRAKILNFSIAYGKTAHGLASDWGVDVKDAQETVDLWYSDRKEVRAWQEETKRLATERGYVTTILGRRRNLPDMRSSDRSSQSHASRAAINTPIQGSAADVAMLAMIQISRCPRLKELGWTLLLQVHDEVILEGPEESADVALDLVKGHMERPFQVGDESMNLLVVDLAVDGNTAKTWYEAK